MHTHFTPAALSLTALDHTMAFTRSSTWPPFHSHLVSSAHVSLLSLHSRLLSSTHNFSHPPRRTVGGGGDMARHRPRGSDSAVCHSNFSVAAGEYHRTSPKMLSCVPFSTPIVLSLPVYPFGWMACFGSLVFHEASPPPCLNNMLSIRITITTLALRFHSKFTIPFPRCQQSAHTCGEFDIVVHVPEAVTKDCEPRKLFLYLASQRRR